MPRLKKGNPPITRRTQILRQRKRDTLRLLRKTENEKIEIKKRHITAQNKYIVKVTETMNDKELDLFYIKHANAQKKSFMKKSNEKRKCINNKKLAARVNVRNTETYEEKRKRFKII